MEAKGTDSRTGWLVVAAAFLCTFTVMGVTYSFGATFSTLQAEFDTASALTSMFFAITTFVYFFLGLFTGRIADKFGPATVVRVGAVAMAAGLVLTSRVNSVWLGFITYGLGVGIGVACSYVPMVATVGAWFERDRTKALGVAVSGIGVGTLVGAPLATWLVDEYGWRTTYVILGLASFVLLMIASFGAKRPPIAVDAGPLPSLRPLMNNPTFVRLYVSMLITTMALFVPFVYIDDYLTELGGSGGSWLISIIGVTSVVGRLGLGALASKMPLMGLYRGSFLVMGLSFTIWLVAGDSMVMLVVFSVVLGVSYGGFIALAPAVAVRLFGPVGLGGILGALYSAAGIGVLIGTPLTGALIDRFGYTTAISTSLVLALTGAFILMLIPSDSPEGLLAGTKPAGADLDRARLNGLPELFQRIAVLEDDNHQVLERTARDAFGERRDVLAMAARFSADHRDTAIECFDEVMGLGAEFTDIGDTATDTAADLVADRAQATSQMQLTALDLLDSDTLHSEAREELRWWLDRSVSQWNALEGAGVVVSTSN
jgi:MFS family permease